MGTTKSIQIQGQQNDYRRVATGLYSLDAMLADHRGYMGYPADTITELYGPPSIGKSTTATFLAGRLSAQVEGTELVIVDLEVAYEEDHLVSNLSRAGFAGVVRMVSMVDDKGKPRTHETVLQEAVDSLQKESVSAIVVDSIGAVTPQGEINNPLGAANMGKRGQLMAQVCRRIFYRLQNTAAPKFVFLVNHQYDSLGGIGKGRITPGGNAKTYAAANRITMYNQERFENGDSHVALRMDKMRLGGVKKKARAYVYIIPGLGVSPEMTAVFDCIIAGHAQRKTTITLNDGTKCGRLSALRDKAVEGDTEAFEPFYRALTAGGFIDTTPEPDEGGDNDED